jgi:hypothetical protein
MIQHLTRNSMYEFTKSVVSKDRWESGSVNLRLSCFPGQPLHVNNIRRFMPSCHLHSLQTHPNSRAIGIQYSLPVGIFEPDLTKLGDSFDSYLNDIVNNHLIELAKFTLELRSHDRSSQAFRVLCTWFQTWKEHVSLYLQTTQLRKLN